MSKILIFDGYNKKTPIGPAHGYPELTIWFRPALPEEVAVFRMIPKVSGHDQIKETCAFLQKHVLKWDAEDAKGNTAPVDFEHLRRVPEPYLDAMVAEVCGRGLGAASDANADAKN